jgi:AbrB family looped-hinge helix DNA binding protein
MPAAVSTITQTGQVSIPKVIRDILGVGPHDQVEFLSDGERVQIVAVPRDPLTLGTREEFWESVARADEDYASGRTSSVQAMTESLRSKHGL